MTLSDKIAIAAGILSFSGFTIKGTILYFNTKQQKMKAIFSNPYIKTFIIILSASILIALLPFDKIHYGDCKDIKTTKYDTIYKHDTVVVYRNRVINNKMRDVGRITQ